jgi:eukaryotic-like serine/threonine-protein kinase
MALQPGATLGPYEIVSLLGAGGMGEVYRARDTRLDRRVALKVLAPSWRPIQTSAHASRAKPKPSRRSITHIFAGCTTSAASTTPTILCSNCSKERRSRRVSSGARCRPVKCSASVSRSPARSRRPTARASSSRDLKPANVMITPAGIKLLDFGLAKNTTGPGREALSQLATAPGSATAQGAILGTLPYMSPDQVQGLPVDARTDLFALGTTLHEMATGRRAFEATRRRAGRELGARVHAHAHHGAVGTRPSPPSGRFRAAAVCSPNGALTAENCFTSGGDTSFTFLLNWLNAKSASASGPAR